MQRQAAASPLAPERHRSRQASSDLGMTEWNLFGIVFSSFSFFSYFDLSLFHVGGITLTGTVLSFV